MSDNNRKNLNRVNFFDGQRVTEIDLDDEQFYFLNKVNNIAVDFHSSGVLDVEKLKRRVLLDTSDPGKYGENPSTSVIAAGEYDGSYINTDIQPSDSKYGNKLEVELFGSDARGRDAVKVLIIGKTFNSLEQGGDLIVELLDFTKNETKLTKNYFTKINGIILERTALTSDSAVTVFLCVTTLIILLGIEPSAATVPLRAASLQLILALKTPPSEEAVVLAFFTQRHSKVLV